MSEQNCSLQIARIKQSLGPSLTADGFTGLLSISYAMVCPSLSEVSNFEQMAAARGRTLISGFGAGGWPMSIADQFWQYAKEAILSAPAKTDGERRNLLEFARIWTQAARQERQLVPVRVLSSPSAKGTGHAS